MSDTEHIKKELHTLSTNNKIYKEDIDRILKICTTSLDFLEKAATFERNILDMYEETKLKLNEMTKENEKLLFENNMLNGYYEELVKSKKILSQENIKLNNIIDDLKVENESNKNYHADNLKLILATDNYNLSEENKNLKECLRNSIESANKSLEESNKSKENIQKMLIDTCSRYSNIVEEYNVRIDNYELMLKSKDKTINILTQEVNDCKIELDENIINYKKHNDALKQIIQKKNKEIKNMQSNKYTLYYL